jgi:hypothetical protein
MTTKNTKEEINQQREREGAYLGHFLTPSCVSLDSGGFFSILIPSFSVAMVSALIEPKRLPTLFLEQLTGDKVKGDECLVLANSNDWPADRPPTHANDAMCNVL